METIGTVSTTKHSSTITGSGTAFDADTHEGKLFRIFENNVWYLIKTVVSATEITLDSAYRGESVSGVYFELGSDTLFSVPDLINNDSDDVGAGLF